MSDKLIETIARWLCEERDPGILLIDPGYWTRYKPAANIILASLDAAGLQVSPKEPTPEMIAAAGHDGTPVLGITKSEAAAAYRAMNAAWREE